MSNFLRKKKLVVFLAALSIFFIWLWGCDSPKAVHYNLTLIVEGEGTTIPKEGTHSFEKGLVVDVEAKPKEGWMFQGWLGDVADNTVATTTILMDSHQEITATFVTITEKTIVMIEDVEDVEVIFGTPIDEAITSLATTTKMKDNKDNEYDVTLSWSILDYDSHISNSYLAKGSFQLPQGVVQPDPPLALEVEAEVTVLPYEASGAVRDKEGLGIAEVTISFTGNHSSVATNSLGEWEKHGLTKRVTTSPYHEEYAFSPKEQEIVGETEGVDFVGARQQVTTIGPEGGSATSYDELVLLEIEGGSLAQDTPITIYSSFLEAPYSFGSLYTFLPEGTTFEPPALLTISFKELELPTDLTAEEEHLFIEGLRIGHYTEEGWEHLPTTLNKDEKTLSAEIAHFSDFGIYPNQQYLVAVDIIGEGTVEPGYGLFYYAPKEVLYLSAIPEKDWVFKGFTIYLPGELLPIQVTDPDPEPIILDHGEGEDISILQISVIATFEYEPFIPQVELHVSKEGEGDVTPPVGTHLYDLGATAHLFAYPDPGWWFEKWVLHTSRGLEDDIFFEDSSISYELDEDMWAKATFIEAPITYDLTIEKEGEGSVEPKEGTREYPKDWRVTLRATPDLGWYLDQWLITDSLGNSYSILHEEEIELEVTKDLTARAIFKDNSFYTIYGFASLDDGSPLENVTISFSGGYEPVTTDARGFWQKEGLEGSVLVKATKENISFAPNQIQVVGATAHVNFVGLQDYDLIFYDTVKIMGREAKENIQSITENSLLFSEVTPFVDSLQVGDILIAQLHKGAHLSLQANLPEEGLLVKITDISDEGKRLSFTEAYLDETIQSGTLIIEERFPYEEMFADLDSHPRIMFFDPIERTLEFRKEMASDVWIEGHLKFELDFNVNGTISFAEGVEDCQFSISPFMEVEVKLIAEKEATLAREMIIYSWDPTHIRVPLFPGAYFQPRIDFLVGARGSMEAKMETGVAYSRRITAGIKYSKESGWERVSHMPDGDWEVQEPTFAATAEGEAYAGVKFSGMVNHLVGLYAGPYLYLDADATIDTAAFLWEYRLGIGLKLVTGASLEILRIASLSYDLPSINLYHTDIAYGISGQVVDWDIFGIEEAKVTFTGEKGPFAPVYPAGEYGLWYKHLLEGVVMVRPELEGYTFVEEEIEVQEARSKVNFFGSYEVLGNIQDKEEAAIGGVELTFDRFPEMKATTSADGSWKQTDLYGAVRITPFKEGYAFEPPSITVDTYDKAVNFTGSYKVSGYVRDEGGNAVPGIQINFSYPVNPVTTNEQGYFERDELSGAVRVTPVLLDSSFIPSSIVVDGPRTNLEFILGYTASGYVRGLDEVGIGGVEMRFLGEGDPQSVITASDGRWEKKGLAGDVIVTPKKDGYTFDPYSRVIDGPSNHVDFTGTYEATGWIVNQDGVGFPDIFISYMTYPNRSDSLQTDSNGFWSIQGLSGRTTIYIVGCPNTIALTGPAYNLRCTIELFDLFGFVKNNLGDGIAGQEIAFRLNDYMTISFDSVYTDSDGYWSKENLYSKVNVRAFSTVSGDDGFQDYAFQPVFHIVGAEAASESIDFVATYSIKGNVRTPDGLGVGNVEIRFIGDEPYGSLRTPTSGYYHKSGFSGAVRVVPYWGDALFVPSYVDVHEKTTVNFTIYLEGWYNY